MHEISVNETRLLKIISTLDKNVKPMSIEDMVKATGFNVNNIKWSMRLRSSGKKLVVTKKGNLTLTAEGHCVALNGKLERPVVYKFFNETVNRAKHAWSV